MTTGVPAEGTSRRYQQKVPAEGSTGGTSRRYQQKEAQGYQQKVPAEGSTGVPAEGTSTEGSTGVPAEGTSRRKHRGTSRRKHRRVGRLVTGLLRPVEQHGQLKTKEDGNPEA